MSGGVRQGEVCLAHLSDPHVFEARALRPHFVLDKRLVGGLNALLRRRRIHRPAILEAALDAVSELRPDHLVVTGDVSTLGAEAELRRFHRLVSGLGLPERGATVLPGNHDAYVGRAVRSRLFGRVFGAGQFSDPPFEGQTRPLVRLVGPVAIIGCDSARPSLPFLAVGSLGVGQLARLEATLADPRIGDRFRIVALHHPPHPAGHWHNRLTDADALREVLAGRGAELILHGHLHDSIQATLPGPAGPIPVRGVASASSAQIGPGRRAEVRLYRIRGRDLLEEQVFRYNPTVGRFRREG